MPHAQGDWDHAAEPRQIVKPESGECMVGCPPTQQVPPGKLQPTPTQKALVLTKMALRDL